MIVLDASATVDVLLRLGEQAEWVEARVAEAASLHAPHLIDYEVVAALRGRTLAGKVSAARGASALQDYLDLPLRRYPAAHLLKRIWQLRPNLSSYDAAYIALAEALGAPLVTTDGRLARASGHRAAIESFPG